MTIKLGDSSPSRLDIVKWLGVITLLVVGVVANTHFAGQPLPLRVIAWLALLAVTGLLAFKTERGRRVWQFAREARAEMRRVTWPTRKETMQTTLLVMIMVSVVALLLWGIDFVVLSAIGWITR